MQQCDALFVINQDIKVSDLRKICSSRCIKSALFLTTHRTFPTEQEKIQNICNSVNILSFSDLLTDDDMIQCDDKASHLLLAGSGSQTQDYNSRFMARSLWEKNRLVHEKISLEYTVDKIFYQPGLGVSEPYWRGKGLSISGGKKSGQIHDFGKNFLSRALNALRQAAGLPGKFFSSQPTPVDIIRMQGQEYVFLSPLHRIRLQPGTEVATGTLGQEDGGREKIYCMTIHGYNRALAEELGGVLVFVDGYHPANYPRSYLDYYAARDVFVVRTMFDERWFAANGRQTVKPPEFIVPEIFAPCGASAAARILIALNHAGDWTALINRSDTDDLVLAAVALARRLPDLSFRLRLHPTASHPDHEGLNAAARIAALVRDANLGNLDISTSSLSEDMAWSEVCLSEYSQVLLDAWRMGKLGVAVNLTRRRSFMQDYADLGFFQTSSVPQTIDILRSLTTDPRGASRQQNEAVASYNRMLESWLGISFEPA